MAKQSEGQSAAHQSKKKRTDDDSTSNPSDKIQLQRRRVWRACESCRRKKIKCDGCEPTCSQCSASGSACTWLQTKDRAALSRHYVQELEARLLHMESLFKQVAPVLEQIGSTSNGVASPPSEGSAGSPREKSPAAAAAAAILRSIAPQGRTSEPTTPIKIEDDMSESFGQLALDEYGHMRWIGGSSSMSLIQSFRALTTAPQHRISPVEEDHLAPGPSINKLYFPASVFFGKVHALPGPEEVEYPDRDLADKLVDTYFSRLHYLMPVIDKPSFLVRYHHVMNSISDSTAAREVAQSWTAFISLIFAVFSCAANIVDDIRLTSASGDDGGMGMVYYERALILQYISHARNHDEHVQCFVLLSSFLCSINCLPQAWILVGQAVRTGQDLGLHRSPKRLSIPAVDKQTRIKIWWGVYNLDRMLAVALGRPLGINDSDCDVELPIEVDDDLLPQYLRDPDMDKPPSLMTGFVALTQLYRIAGHVLREVYALDNCKDHLEPEKKVELERTVEALHAEVTQWCDNLPPNLKNQSSTNEQAAMAAVLCSHFYSVLTTLHRNLLPVRREDPTTTTSTSHAVSSARSCIALASSIYKLVPSSHHLAFFIQHLFSSAVIVLLYAMHSSEAKTSTQALEEAKGARSAIELWEGQWPGARKCKELLTELIDTATAAVAKTYEGDAAMSNVISAPKRHERRRSVTIATATPNTIPGRMLKTNIKQASTRRNRSREQTGAGRRFAASPYHVDTALRARSSSRKRGHDEIESKEGSFYQSFASPTLAQAASNTSSPSSMNLPSPAMSNSGLVQDTSPTLASTSTYSYGDNSSTRGPSSPLYDYNDYGMSGSSLSQPSWNNGGDIYGEGNHPMAYDPYNYNAMDPMYYDANGISHGLSTTPPTSSFDAPGLPFRGFDFIRNFPSNGSEYPPTSQDLWPMHDFDRYVEPPFNLNDLDIPS